MDWLELLYKIAEVCLIPLLGVLTAFFIKWLKAKEAELLVKVENDTADKYIQMLTDTVASCVLATSQTYVEALKKDNAFTKEAQQQAFDMTYNAVIDVLTADAKEYLTNIYGDLSVYISNKIEAEVKMTKKFY